MRRLAEQSEQEQKAHIEVARWRGLLSEDIKHVGKLTDNYKAPDGRFNRDLSMIHAEAERKRNAGDRWDRVAGRIESLIQSRARDRGGPDLG